MSSASSAVLTTVAAVPLTDADRAWFLSEIARLDPNGDTVAVETSGSSTRLRYSERFRSDETLLRAADSEELVRALTVCLLCSAKYGYSADRMYLEQTNTISADSNRTSSCCWDSSCSLSRCSPMPKQGRPREVNEAEAMKREPRLPTASSYRASAALASYRLAAGRYAEAHAELQRSLAVWREVGATRYVRDDEALLATSA